MGARLVVRLGWLFLLFPVSAAFAQEDPLGIQRRIVSVFEQNQSKVLRIKAAYESREGGERQVSLRVGTGFFISSDGLLLSNASVTLGARRIWAEHEGFSYPAELVGADEESNIALLRLKDIPDEGFDFISIDERSFPAVGTILLSIGCALEFDPAPRMGLVSGMDARFGSRVFPTTYLRTTIPANPGEGGAPVLDLNGRLLGMIVASLPEVNASYVIPAGAVGKVKDDLLLDGEVRYGWIGLEMESRPRRKADPSPLVVTDVVPSGPAAEGKLAEGDRVLAVNGERIRSMDQMREIFFLARIGQYLEFEISRDEKVLNRSIQVKARPSGEEEPRTDPPGS